MPPPVMINIPNVAGGYADTGSQGTTLGFIGPVTAYAAANVVNSVFSGPGPFKFPLTAGAATTIASSSGTMSPLGPVTGTTYLAPDNSFFYADLVPVNQPAQREVIYGGTQVNPAFYKAISTTPTYLAFAVQPDFALQSGIPFIRGQTGGSLSSPSVSPLVFAIPANTTFSTPNATTKALQASLAVNGSGAQQSSVLVVLVGNVFGPTGTSGTLAGAMHGSFLANGASQPVRINTYYQPPADGNGNGFYGKSSISGFTLAPGSGAANAVEVNTANQTTTANYQFVQPVIPTSLPAAANGTQTTTTQTLNGFFGGIMTKEPIAGSGTPLPYAVTGTTMISTNAGNQQLAATLSGGDPFTSRTSGIPAANGIVLQYGSTQTGATNARQAFINDKLFAALESPTTPSTVAGVQASFSSSYPNTNPNIYLVTQTAAPPPASLLPSGLCSSCQYLQWGYWGGEVDTPSQTSPARIDVGHINFWVAGTPATSMTDISSLKASNFSGTYNGNLVGSVINNGAQYLASGGLQAIYHFGTQTGSFTVSNYDKLPTFTASGSVPLSGSNYKFAFNKGGINGMVNGGFYGPLAAETGGNFAFTAGPAYFTSGIYAAKR
jgi:trimeric autotransporter adhesin